ncbi:MAG: hypothetical protein JWO32_263 [Bacteroidetes bacterium]|nr:hypothetical protein [Bacteroidota bacterium]
MKKIILLFLACLFLSLISSCAIHRKFPFICFKKECVLGQLGYYSARESFKRAKINASVRKHKRIVKRNVRRGRKGLDPPYDLAKEKKQADSLTYQGGFAGICKEIKMVFLESTKRDSVLITYKFEQKDISPEGKKIIKELVDKIGPHSFTGITIFNCHKKSVLSEYEVVWMDERVRKIKKYLKSIGIENLKVFVDE